MASGIYAIQNLQNGKRYIGKSVDLEKRKTEHKNGLIAGRHYNKHLQNAWNKGYDFAFMVVEYCDKEDLDKRERFWIKEYNTTDPSCGYNICKGGEGCLGRPCSTETREKLSKAQKGRHVPEERKKKRIKTFKERMRTDPTMREHFVNGVTEKHKNKLRMLYSGEKSLSAKLKTNDVVQIRLRYMRGERQCKIRKDYPQIAQKTMSDIVQNRRWKSVPNTLEELEEMERNYGTEILRNP